MEDKFKLIIACEVFRGELEFLKDDIKVDILWVEHSLHDNPSKLQITINEKIQEIEESLPSDSDVLLFFGNCGGALDGVKSKTLNLYYPDVADCIPIILGSIKKFGELHSERPGTFYLNKAWIDSGLGPLGSSKKYANIYGPAKGWKAVTKMYKNYTHFALIDNGYYELDFYRRHVQEACELFNKEYLEEKATLDFVRQVLNNQCRMKTVLAKAID